MLSPSDHIALLSLPSLGLFRVPRRVRDATLGVIIELLPEASVRTLVPGRVQYAGQRRNYVLPGARGRCDSCRERFGPIDPGCSSLACPAHSQASSPLPRSG